MTRGSFRALAESKIVILDGATGSNLHKLGMDPGKCPEKWMIENSDKVIDLQRRYIEAGTDILFAPTFTANRLKLKEYGMEGEIARFNRELTRISRKAVELYNRNSNGARKVYVAADMTMTGEMVAPAGKLSFEELVNIYKEQAAYILEEEPDLFVIETMMSLQECRAALLAVRELCDLPVMVSLTYQENNRTLHGTDPVTATVVLQAMGADAVGVNCSTGPDRMHDIIRQMKNVAHVPILAKPNAGIPFLKDGSTVFPMGPEEFAAEMKNLILEGAGIVGGCCGTTPGHIGRLSETAKDLPLPKISNVHCRALTTETRTVPINISGRFMVAGERINPTGKKALQAALKEGRFAPIAEMACEQAEQGADFLDINVGMGGIDEKEAMLGAIQEVIRAVDVPLLIDTSNPDVMEAALRIYPGRALINSISLESAKVDRLLPLAKKYGAMFILLPISDRGLPKDVDERIGIIHEIIDKAYEIGLTKEDIIVDGLVTTVGANPRGAVETLETIRYCREKLGMGTIIGLSNISFGLPGRQHINSTFLAFAIQAGLTMAIANPSQDLLMNTALASDLLLGKDGAADRYIENVVEIKMQSEASDKGRKGGTETERNGKAVETAWKPGGTERENADKPGKSEQCRQDIYRAVLKGKKEDIVNLVGNGLALGLSAGDLLDGVLIPAINEVGRLFDSQRYFLPQLISAAETMKLAVDYLEPMLAEATNGEKNRGTVVAATVAGDIHDIGKNLVVLMLKNYGYRVIDLGKDVDTDLIIRTARDENADIIALSALMTTTMVEMKRVIEKARSAGLKSRIIIGGAVVTESYAVEIGADGYAPDARSAVDLVKQLIN
ncbi:MAG: dihydropteroate synthase [Clostridiales bacterium]|nr:dihydropteroate synthase [Clostridiales bacterium]